MSAGRKNRVWFEADGTGGALAWDAEAHEQLWLGHRDRPNELHWREPGPGSDYPSGHAEGFPDTFKQLYRAVYRAVEAGGMPDEPDFPTFRDGHEGVVLGEAIAASARDGRWVDVRALMLGVTKTGPGTVELTERPEPVVRAGHVVLDVVGAGICGTDLHIWDDEFPSEPPVTMGHEVSGVVREVGEGVAGWAVGDRVVSETYFSTCGECEWCRGGRLNLCAQRRSIGSREDGAFAPLLLVPARGLHRIPDWLDGHAASLAEPLACVCNCLLDPQVVSEGDSVLVVGPGPVGLLAAQVAAACGGDGARARDGARRGAARAGARARLRDLGRRRATLDVRASTS